MKRKPTIGEQIEDAIKSQYYGTILRRLAAEVRELQQALPATAAKIVVGKSEHPLTKTVLENGVKMLDEYVRLQKLSNRQLVDEATGSNAADYMIVNEMMTRLDPDWSKENRPPEQAKPGEQRIPDQTGMNGPLGEHGQRPPSSSGEPPPPAETPEPTVDLVKKIISNAMAVVAHWNEFGPERCFEEDVARLEKLVKEYRLGQSQQLEASVVPSLAINLAHLEKVIAETANAWLDANLGIPWNGGIDAAMKAAVEEIKRLRSQQPAPDAKPVAKCTCWLGRGVGGGDSREREACAVHGLITATSNQTPVDKSVKEVRIDELETVLELIDLSATPEDALKTLRSRLAELSQRQPGAGGQT